MTGYRAFLTYSHKDLKLAKKLHTRLEEFEIPKALRKARSRRPCAPIYRDRDEMGSDPHLKKSITAALEASDCLLVLSTRNSAESGWVDLEAGVFLARTPRRPVIIFVPQGEIDEDGRPFLPPTLQAASAQELIEVVNAGSDELGFEGGLATVASRLTGIDALTLQKAEARRRRRSLTVSVVVKTTAAVMATLSIFFFLLSVAGAIVASSLALSAYDEVHTGTREVWQVATQPGPTVKLNQQVWRTLLRRLRTTMIAVPMARVVPGARAYNELMRIGLLLEASDNAYKLGNRREALAAARLGRFLADQWLQQKRMADQTLISGFTMWDLTDVELRLNQRAWAILAQAQIATGDIEGGLVAGQSAVEAGRILIQGEGAEEADVFNHVETTLKFAMSTKESRDGTLNWRAGYAIAKNEVDSLPDTGTTRGGEAWAVVKSRLLAQLYSFQAAAAAQSEDRPAASEAIAKAESIIESLTEKDAGPAFRAFLQFTLNDARSFLARDRSDWRRIADIAGDAQKDLRELDFSASNPGANPLLAAGNRLQLARTRQHLGEEYRTLLSSSLAKSRELARQFPDDFLFDLSIADSLVSALEIEIAAGECGAAEALRSEAAAEMAQLLKNNGEMPATHRLQERLLSAETCVSR